MSILFLHGGGDEPQVREQTFGRFVSAATAVSPCHLALLVAAESESVARESFAAYRNIFTSLSHPPQKVSPLFVTPSMPLQAQQLEVLAPTAVFVCGGMTPLYHQALCINTSWLSYLHQHDLPYGGTSAGTAVASQNAILGGWRTHGRAILFQGASEGLDLLTVKPGLGLVSFATDVHASQLGTLTRLIHAVEQGLADEGWGIDENTALFLENGQLSVCGIGQAYHVWRNDGGVQLTIHAEGIVK